ncbi:hypothetical protein [Phycicoccus sonneratiae]|uniref:Uncharacterized protein n=1 Tax=Phycicoccus sonneratiae TaxID=2807628 RepID=A0ABS2CHV3_9MICO|nr:hypothetical protein [Phycicoccus sonneraticus]MBM6399452.1 hypothetical protein [Phycicoccus sonneraticus]
MPAPTEECFRALTRPGPWRFTTLRFTHRRADGEQVEAWLRRPGWLRVRTSAGRLHVLDERPARGGPAADPAWRPDWPAMLAPVELAVGTDVGGLAATTRHGRETWWARMTATEGYEPRCPCGSLLGGWGVPWVVGLDVATGVVVSTGPLGEDADDLGFTVTIHAVDDPLTVADG